LFRKSRFNEAAFLLPEQAVTQAKRFIKNRISHHCLISSDKLVVFDVP
jgi:hypothetical protein